MACSDRGSAAVADSSKTATVAPSLSADVMSEGSVVLRHSIGVVLKGADVGENRDNLAFREGAAERRHGAGFAIADARDDEIVAAFGSRQLRPLALGAAAVLVAKAAHGGKQGGSVDVVRRRLGRRRSRGLGGRAWILLRPNAGGRKCERECCKHRAITQDRYPHHQCRRPPPWDRGRPARPFKRKERCGRDARGPQGRGPPVPSYCLSANTNRAPVFFAMLLKGSPHSAANSSDTRLPQPAGTAIYCLPPAM